MEVLVVFGRIQQYMWIKVGLCLKETTCGDFKAVVVEVAGHAYYSGVASFTLENDDTLKNGFLLRWAYYDPKANT